MIEDLLGDDERRAGLIARGHQRVGAWSWTQTAEATADVYRELV